MDNLKSNFGKIKEIHKSLCSTIYAAIELKTELPVIIKLKADEDRTLKNELKFYRHLQREGETSIAPKLVWAEEFTDGTSAMALEALGLNLEQLFAAMNRQMSLRTLIQFGELMIRCIEKLHSLGVLHCDIRPENILTGQGADTKRLYLIGFSKAEFIGEYEAPEIGKRIARRASFQSLSSQMGFRYGFRDDLESIGLMLVYFYEGQLPWQGILVDDDETRFDLIARIKSQVKIEHLCVNLPRHFRKYFRLCRKLKADEVPDYNAFIKVFRKMKSKNGVIYGTCSAIGVGDAKMKSEADARDENQKSLNNERIDGNVEYFGNIKSVLRRTRSQILAKAILDSSDDDFNYFNGSD